VGGAPSGPGKHPLRRRDELGFSLMLVIFVIVLLGFAVGTLHQLLSNRQGAFRQQSRQARLRALGDAAVDETLAHLSLNARYRGLPDRQFGGGRISSDVTPDRPNVVRVVATARIPGWVEVVKAEVDVATNRPRVTNWERTPPRRDGAG
jgi:hypothetical protein